MAQEQLVKTSCALCTARCGLNVYLSGGRIVKVEGMPEHPISQGYICPKGETIIDYEYSPDRLKYPMRKENGTWKRISWDEALDLIATKLKDNKANYGAKSLVVFIGGPIFLDGVPSWMMLRRFLDVYGSPNYFSVDSMCYRPRLVAYYMTFAEQMRAEVQNSKLIGLVGANVDNSYPTLAQIIRRGQEKGAKLVVLDPRKIPLAKEADIHLQLRPGTDCAVFLAMMNVIISEGLYDKEFIDRWTVGFDKLAEHVKAYTPEMAAEISGVPAEQIREAARLFGTIRPASIYQGFNTLDQTTSGFQNARAICILETITGNVDIQGGFVPRMMLNVKPIRLAHMLETKPLWYDEYPLMYEVWGRPLGEGQGMDLPDVLLTEKPYPIKAMIIDGTNPALTWPNSNKVVEALKKTEFLVVMDVFMTPTAELAHLVLPAAGPLGKTDFCIDNRIAPYVMLKKKVNQFEESWHDAKFWLKLAQRMGFEEYFPWKDPEEFIDYWLEPSGFSIKMLTDEKPGGMPLELQYGIFREKGFPTPSGKVEIYSETMEKFGYDPMPTYREPWESPVSTPDLAREYPLILTTGTRYIEFLHTQGRNIPKLRELVPEPLAEIHPEAAQKRGIKDGDRITISTKRGSIEIKAKVTEDILPQVVNIPHGWREANCNLLTFARPADPVTGVPNYKALLCEIAKSGK